MRFSIFMGIVGITICSASADRVIAPRPNILVFYVDDMGWGSIGPNGQTTRVAQGLPAVRTPHLNRLAAQGINFTRGYGCTVCSPARSSLQTGFHQGHTFADRNDPDNAKKAIRKDDISIGTVLSGAGYATGYWGKWGYGGSKDQDQPRILNVQTLPTSHGYQHVLAELHHVRAHTFFQPTLWKAPAQNAKGGLRLVPNTMRPFLDGTAYPQEPARQDHSDYPRIAYCDDRYAMEALKFVRTQGEINSQTGQPFHALLAVQIPHAPFGEISTLPDWDAAYRGDPGFQTLSPQAQQWASMVTRIDAHFGNILRALEDPNNDGDTADSIAHNTLVVFTSDNGGPAGKNNVELDANGGLRGNKGTIFEGGIRVPLVMKWPRMMHASSPLRPGTSTDRVVDVTDLLPTFSDLAGAETPLGIDGVSFAPLLTGDGQLRGRDYVIHEARNGQSIIRGNHKLIRPPRGRAQLYDLGKDIREELDISESHPDLVKELNTLLVGERVREPKGFANSYHSWVGDSGRSTADAEHWSDYEYANDGVTYLSDDGSPQKSWVAVVGNYEEQPNTALVNSDLDVLAIQVHGNANGHQILKVDPDVVLNGRNEVRILDNGTIRLDGGSVSTLRWVDIRNGGRLVGHGTVEGHIYNGGELKVDQPAGVSLRGDFRQSGKGKLATVWSPRTALTVDGAVHICGRLEVLPQGKTLQADDSMVLLTSTDGVSGRFDCLGDSIQLANGLRVRLTYSRHSIIVTVE